MRQFGIAVGMVVAAGLLAGCQQTASTEVALYDQDYKRRHPILVSEEPQVLDIPVGMRVTRLSPQIQRRMRSFVTDYKRTGTGSVTIQVPSGSANEIAAVAAGRSAGQTLRKLGVPAGRIRIAPYQVDDHGKVAPVRMAFLKLKAHAPDCGIWPEDIGRTTTDRSYYNFGCAQQQNLAAMIENPADLVRPRDMTAADGAQRARVIDQYRQGQNSSSDLPTRETSSGL
jgi:pilus assembly protein CpaD